MARQYWLQYHNFDKEGPPGCAIIHTNKDEFKFKLRLNQDVIFLIVGLEPKPSNLRACGISPSILATVDSRKRFYFIWEKFVAEEWDYLGEKQFGGFDYEISGDEEDCIVYKDSPIVLTSPEFRAFWASYNQHGFICLSDHGCPFPELEQTGEGLIFRRGRTASQSKLGISDKVTVSQEVWKGIALLRQKLSRQQLCNLIQVDTVLRRYGHSTTADWIRAHPKEYLGGWQFGFDVKLE